MGCARRFPEAGFHHQQQGAAVAFIPTPRPPRCLRHHVRMAACPACDEQARWAGHQPAPVAGAR